MGTPIGNLIERKEITLDSLSGKTVAVDSFNIIYQFLSSIRGEDGNPLMDERGNITSHLSGLFYRSFNLLQKNISPAFVFDGKHHQLKSKTVEARNKIRTDAREEQKKALEEGDMEKARMFGSRALFLNQDMLKDAKTLIEAMGFPIIQSPSEGEAQIAYLVQQGKVYGGVSQDYDSLLFGCPRILRNITVSGKRKIPSRNAYMTISPEMIILEEALQKIQLSRQKLIWLAMLIGTDFNEKFPKIGPKTALKLVQKFNSFEEIIKETKYEIDFDWKEVEDIFLNPEFNDNYKIEFKLPDKEKIMKFLCDDHGFDPTRVQNILDKVILQQKEQKAQSKLGMWG